MELELAALGLERGHLAATCQEREQQLTATQAGAKKLQSGAEEALMRTRRAERERDELATRAAELEKRCEHLNVELTACKRDYNQLMLELQGEKEARAEAEADVRLCEVKEEKLQQGMAKLQRALAEKESGLAALTEEFNSLQQIYLVLKNKNEQLSEKYIAAIKKQDYGDKLVTTLSRTKNENKV